MLFLSGSEGTQLRMHVSVGGSRQELSTAVSIAPAPHPLLFGLLFALEYKNFTQFFSDFFYESVHNKEKQSLLLFVRKEIQQN